MTGLWTTSAAELSWAAAEAHCRATWPWLTATQGVLTGTPPLKKASAVCVLFIPPVAAGEPARLVFTRRSTKVRSHKGQISFAGGRCEATDLGPADTALREMHEELGIHPAQVQVVGLLPPQPALDRHLVYPVVATSSIALAELAPAPAEVDAVFAEAWPYFGHLAARRFSFNIFGNWRSSQVYGSPSGAVWGLTAHILFSAALA